jgi:peptide chain release factor 1
MLKRLEKLDNRYQELEHLLASPEVISKKDEYSRYAKELSDIQETVYLFREYQRACREIQDLQQVIKEKADRELLELAKAELVDLSNKKVNLEERIKESLTGEDEDLGKDVIVEIRQGTGGMEAGLFVADLYRMYTKYAIRRNWTVEEMSGHPTEVGGFKEIIFSVKGKDAYKRLKFESGVHRVQRVPETEAQGRIHTSTITVAVLAEPREVEIEIEPKDLRIDTYRSSGPGGQHMQKTDSAVRITHVPSGTVVVCQDERSQLKNKNKAMRILRARILDVRQLEEIKKISSDRRSQIGSGDRSEKIRTYNFPDRRITDHRINFTTYRLEEVLNGDLDELSDALVRAASEKEKSSQE